MKWVGSYSSSLASVKSPVTRAAVACLDQLERRTLFAGGVMSTTAPGTLLIDGTESADVLSLRYRGPRLQVRLNGALQNFVAREVQRIEIQALDGNDIVDWSSIAIPTYINAGLGNDLVYGGSGNDSLTGAAGKDTLYGNGGNDRVNGGVHNDVIYGGDGDDVVYAGDGNDYFIGGTGRDRAWGEEGDDTLLGGVHGDALYGGGGKDRLYGERGNDILSGDGGNDGLWGGDDADILYGGAGGDALLGEAGDDTLMAKGDGAIDNLDGGDGTDGGEADPDDVVANAENITGNTTPPPTPTPPPVSLDDPIGVSFNDESLWPANFNTAVAEAKKLGVEVVRVWIDINDYSDRPKAYDPVNYEHIAQKWKGWSEGRPETAGLAIQRAFDLKQAGFSVAVTMNKYDGQPPANAQQLKDYYAALLNSTETAGGGMKLKDAVDFWEIGNEVDLPGYWNPPGLSNDKKARIQAYVDQVLLPASEVLHAGNWATRERVLSASVSWSPNDLNTILQRLKTLNKLDAIDFAAYHPYGNTQAVIDRSKAAHDFAAAVGKEIVATEWNVRGFALNGSQDATWAATVDDLYKHHIAPNFAFAFYYAMVDNFDARGGTITARPASLLKHNTSMTITPQSSIADLIAWYNTPLTKNDPFYSTYDGWQDLTD